MPRSPGLPRTFLAAYLPSAGAALALTALVGQSAPGLAPALMLAFCVIAFVPAVLAAVAEESRASADRPAILRLLEMRRQRLRHALVLTVLANLSVGAIAGAAVLCGLPLGLQPGAGQILLAEAALFAAAWFVIGDAAASNDRVRRALLDARAGR